MSTDRVRGLIERMSLIEKLGQLQIVFRPKLEDAAEVVRGGIGSVFWPASAAATNALQRVAVEESRLVEPGRFRLHIGATLAATQPLDLWVR